MTHDPSGAPGPQSWLPGELPAPLAEPAPEPALAPQPGFTPQPGFPPPSGPAGPTAQPGYPGAPIYPGRPPYGGPGAYAPPAPRRTPVLAILSLVFAFLAPIVGLGLAIVALLRGKVDGHGRGLAIAGLVVSVLVTPLYAGVVIPLLMNQRHQAEVAEVRDAFDQVTAAIVDGDCEAYLAGSTSAFQQQTHATTCAQFDAVFAQAGDLGAWLGGVQVTGVRVEDDAAWVSTTEQITWDDGTSSIEAFEYQLVREDGAWLLHSASLVD